MQDEVRLHTANQNQSDAIRGRSGPPGTTHGLSPPCHAASKSQKGVRPCQHEHYAMPLDLGRA
eukprot:9475400-Pyramimonas_sp.AAC.1